MFSFENVRGMADYSLTNSEGELVKMGMLKLWLRCLTAMECITSLLLSSSLS